VYNVSSLGLLANGSETTMCPSALRDCNLAEAIVKGAALQDPNIL